MAAVDAGTDGRTQRLVRALTLLDKNEMRRVPEGYNCLCDCDRLRRRCSGIRSRIVQVVLVAPSLVAPSPVAPSVVARSLVSPSSYARYSLGSLRQHMFPTVLLFHLLFNSANALFFSSFVLMALICSWVYGGRPADAIISVL